MKQYAASLAARVARPSGNAGEWDIKALGVSALRRSCHRLKVAWRSVSINQAVSPALGFHGQMRGQHGFAAAAFL